MITLPEEIVRLVVSFIDPRSITIDQRRVLGIRPRRIDTIGFESVVLPIRLRDVFVVPWKHRLCTTGLPRSARIDYSVEPSVLSCPCGVDRSVVIHMRYPQSGYRVKTWILNLDADGRFLYEKKYDWYVATYIVLNGPPPGWCFCCSDCFYRKIV
jgi:hypothetical protein